MSWTRHLYDPVGAIGRDLLGGGPRRVMTPAEIAQARGGGGQSARDPSRVGGAWQQSRQQPSEASYERRERPEPTATPMAKPMPVLSEPTKGPAAAPVTTGATTRYAGPTGAGVAVIPSANSGLQVGPADGGLAPGRPSRAPVGPLPGQPGNPYTTRIANGEIPQDPQAIAQTNAVMARMRANRPVMSAPPTTTAPSPTGRFGRRPRP